MRLLLLAAALSLRLAAPAVACDFAGPVAPLTVLERSPSVVIARAESEQRFRITESLSGTLSGTHSFRDTDCDPRLVAGRPYLLFLTPTKDGGLYGTAMSESAIELPDDGHTIRMLADLFQRWRNAKDEAARRKLLPEVFATRIPVLVADGIERALSGRLDEPLCARLLRLAPPPGTARVDELRERCALHLLR